MKRKVVCLLLVFMFIFSSISVNSFAKVKNTSDEVKDSGATLISQIHKLGTDPILISKIPTRNSVKNITTKTATPSSWKITDKIFNGTGTLTTDSFAHMYYFSTTQSQSIVLKLVSSNANYVAQLYTVDWSAGTATPTDYLYDFAGDNECTGLPELFKGDYALRVFSTNGTVGDKYTLMMNDTNPAYFTEDVKISDNLSVCALLYAGNKIYSNGFEVTSVPVSWKRSFQLNTDGGYIYQEQNITLATVTGVSSGSYKSEIWSTDNAIFFTIGAGASWQAVTSQKNPNQPLSRDEKDVRGLTTPRTLDNTDITQFSYKHDYTDSNNITQSRPFFCLVYDLNNNKFVDFVSRLNGFYYFDREKFSIKIDKDVY